MSVNRSQRHTKSNRCPICGGCDGDPRGKERRCHGFTTEDGEWCHCTREELAGDIEQGPDQAYAHRMHGPCRCGMTHGEAKSVTRDSFEATYDYCDEAGRLVYQVVRKPDKQFRQRRPHGDGWVWQLEGVRRLLYRLPQVMAADPQLPVYIVEGEKDVESMVSRGYVATCNSGGAGKWGPVADLARTALGGRDVIVVADADPPGRRHATEVVQSLGGAARSVRIVEPPAPYKDVTNLLDAGGSIEAMTEPETPPSRLTELAPELPFDDIWTPEPESQLVVPKWGLGPGPVHLVTGTWYTGKTLLLATLGLSVASGRDLFGLWKVRRGKWLHCDYEMGRRLLKRYVQRLQRGMGLDPEELRGNMSLRVLPKLNLRTEGALDYYTELFSGYSIATLDPLRAAAPGADENKSEFREYLDMLSIAGDRSGCTIVVLHHGGKPVEGVERRNTGRGTSAIDDAVQSKFVLSAKEKGAPMLVTHEKSRELDTTLEDFYLEFVNTPDSVRLAHRLPDELSDLEDRKAQGSVEKAVARLAEAFTRHGGCLRLKLDDIRALTKMKTTVFREACAEAKARGLLSQAGSHHDPVWQWGTP